MRKTLHLCYLFALLTGCAGSLMGTPTTTRTVLRSTPPALTYQQARTIMVSMGAALQPETHANVLTGLFGRVGLLSAQFQPDGTGTRVLVSSSVLPGKVTWGAFTEPDEFCTRLQALETSHAH